MWESHLDVLQEYYKNIVREWVVRGYVNNMPWNLYDASLIGTPEQPLWMKLEEWDRDPWWLGVEIFHSKHRATLLAKNFEYYSQFGWSEEPKWEYWWPTEHIDEMC